MHAIRGITSVILFLFITFTFILPVVSANGYMDLLPTRIDPSSGTINNWEQVYIYATNEGNQCTNADVDVMVELFYPNGTYEGTYTTVIHPWLQPGEERGAWIQFYIDTEGFYRLHTTVDYTDEFAESDETNNVEDFYFESISPDRDGDGVKDIDDACPNEPGYDCNGCRDPCLGCAIMVCDQGTVTLPLCETDDALCVDTICPDDACYTSYCSLDERVIFDHDSVPNSCYMGLNNRGECTDNGCTFTCQYDTECDNDDDDDGVTDPFDQCPSTPLGENVDDIGCSCSQKSCDDGNVCTDDRCDWNSGYCWFQNDNSNECGMSRDCPDDRCEGEYLYYYSPDGHDYCSAGSCTEYECVEDVMYSYECDSDDDDDGDPDVTDCEPRMPQIYHGAPELCNNVDDDCDGIIDMMSEECSGNSVGECSPGYRTCSHGNWGQCEGAVGPSAEICDGLDNDCDGQTDEGCPCVVGETRVCPLQEGVCSGASEMCTAQGWSGCDYGADYESTESSCDGLDNDCDGSIDGMDRSCSDNHFGICSIGTEICELGSWDGCPLPSTETCEGSLDEDCDGAVDEGCDCTDGDTRTCGTDLGICEYGTETCADGMWGSCEGGIEPMTEICDGVLDEDCDGTVDDGCDCTDGQTGLCGTDIGVCEYGTTMCIEGMWGACTGGVEPTDEICDGLDNDCDGLTDETCDCIDGQMRACGSNVGTCEFGITTCIGGAWGACIGGIGSVPELCNGLDDDCDGHVDDGVCDVHERDDIHISQVRILDDEWLKPGDELFVLVTVKNRGGSTLRRVHITAYIDEFGSRMRVGPFDIRSGRTETKTLRMDIPEYASIGLYDLRVSITNDKMRRVKYRQFAVVDRPLYCGSADPWKSRYCSLFS